MAEENSLQGKKKSFMNMYQDVIIMKKDYSFLIIDKSAKVENRLFICQQGLKLSRILFNEDDGYEIREY